MPFKRLINAIFDDLQFFHKRDSTLTLKEEVFGQEGLR
jgi:hypothetical protein